MFLPRLSSDRHLTTVRTGCFWGTARSMVLCKTCFSRVVGYTMYAFAANLWFVLEKQPKKLMSKVCTPGTYKLGTNRSKAPLHLRQKLQQNSHYRTKQRVRSWYLPDWKTACLLRCWRQISSAKTEAFTGFKTQKDCGNVLVPTKDHTPCFVP